MAYGFILPNPKNDRVNLKLTPSADAMYLRRLQFCHVIHDHSQPEQEFMFHVETSNRKVGNREVLKPFSEGLIETLVCMVANAKEKIFITENPGYCIEKVTTPFGGPLSRACIRALSILCEKLEHETTRIETSGSNLG